jgi:hypothetical protein
MLGLKKIIENWSAIRKQGALSYIAKTWILKAGIPYAITMYILMSTYKEPVQYQIGLTLFMCVFFGALSGSLVWWYMEKEYNKDQGQ